MGWPKCGSSAIQWLLARNQGALASIGFDYPSPDPDSVLDAGSANGNYLRIQEQIMRAQGKQMNFAQLQPSRIILSDLLNLKGAIRGSNHSNVILSFEGLIQVDAGVLYEWIKSLKAEGHVVYTVVLVRDLWDYFVSTWKQNVGFGGMPFLLEDSIRFARTNPTPLSNTADLVRMGANVKIISFDHHRKDLSKVFLEGIGVDSTMVSLQSPPVVNSPLSASQASVVALTRRNYGKDFGDLLAQIFWKSGVESANENIYSPSLHQELLGQYREDLHVINTLLPALEQLSLSVRAEKDERITIKPTDLEVAFAAIARYLIPGAASNDGAGASATPPLRREGDVQPGQGGELPIDFDPNLYLLLNSDVKDFPGGPGKHYAQHGRAEGRAYKVR